MVRIRTKFTDLPPEKHGASMFLSLNGEALDAALELEKEVISGKDEVKSIMARLDKLYKKDDTLSKFHALESFETYKQPSTLSRSEYIIEFEKFLRKAKKYGAEMSYDILVYCLLKNAYPNLLTLPKRKQPTNLNYISGSPKAKTHLTLMAI